MIDKVYLVDTLLLGARGPLLGQGQVALDKQRLLKKCSKRFIIRWKDGRSEFSIDVAPRITESLIEQSLRLSLHKNLTKNLGV